MDTKYSFLNSYHKRLGAKMVPFGGWEMPLAYPAGTLAEHLACRSDAVVFDVSHLGTVRLQGEGAFETLQRSFTNDLNKIAPGRAQYTHHLGQDGSVVDDIIVWWVSQDRFDVMPNASNTASVISSIGGTDVTTDRTVLAVQGPAARSRLSGVFPAAAEVGRFRVAELDFEGTPVVVAGTGYTGEDGVEISVPNSAAEKLFGRILEAGVTPAGLGARDTLRLEAALPLHGHELGQGITPYQARLGWVVSMTKGDFIGRAALEAELANGVSRLLFGVKGLTRQPMREHMELVAGGEVVGFSTSGNYSPVLGVGIALCLADPSLPEGAQVELRSGARAIAGTICSLPFVRKSS
ncbi:MAG: glycine cleavage system aminomethyltransferase GcvT [Actinomycetota bacterium]|nr:glycine cleavage system aminomethyltransferase GcvT [Actinomycetota bacterium]